jgi:hypothetical protein
MQHKFSQLIGIGLCLALAMGLAFAQEHPSEPSKQTTKTEPAKSDTAKKEEKKEEEKAFADVIKDYKAIEGLFTLYLKEEENKVLMEIKPDQLDKIFLCSVTLEAGDGRYFDSGAMWDRFPFVFKKVGKKIQLIHKNVYYRAAPNSPISRAVERGVSSSILGSAKLESKPHLERKSFLVDPSGFFLLDYAMVGYILSEFAKIDFAFDKEESYFGALKSFPLNTEIETVIHFKSNKPKPANATIADSRSMQHHYIYSLSTLPETGYRPRLADDRVGHFLTLYQDYTTQTEDTPYIRHLNRWHLEKTDPNAKLSPPKQPIVFWLENTIPVEYRAAITAGVLAWNRAFEKIGFQNALVVKQQPDDADWDPADVRYNTIRWIVLPGGGYAVGPSHTNPFTGQIYDADIRFSADIVRYAYREFEEFVEPSSYFSQFEMPKAKAPFGWMGRMTPLQAMHYCNYGVGARHQAAFGWSLLSVRDWLAKDGEAAKKFLNDFLASIATHEVGHTLGLRHNFRASVIHSLEEAQDKKLAAEEGLTGSVMDYIPVNLAEKGKRQGDYWQTNVGTYDCWAIEYAYKPLTAPTPEAELKELNKIAAKVSEPKLAYGTDEDAFGFSPQGLDPLTNMFDLGDDPLAYYKTRVALAQELFKEMEKKFDREGMRYQKLRLVFGQALNEYFLASLTVSKFIGGMYHRRDHIGDPGKRLPFEPVSAEKQREAMSFLKTYIFGPAAFNFSPSLLNKLAPERFYDFDFSLFYQPRVDFPIHEVVLSLQRFALDRVYNPIVLSRMLDLELHYSKGQQHFTMSELFQQMREVIWIEVAGSQNVNSFRRNLQRAHLAKLISLVVRPTGAPFFTPYSGINPAGMIMPPEDASTLARADLIALQKNITSALSNTGLDTVTRAHLEESQARINATLTAAVQRQM